jgi:hypothetical protein
VSRQHSRGDLWWAVVVVAAGAVSPGPSRAQAGRPADDVVDRFGAYLLDYETKVSELAADEQFEQWVKRRPGYGGATVARRKLQSVFFLIRLPDGQAWYGFRDVIRVDGKAVPPRARAMSDMLGERTQSALDEALAMTRENAKYNIGPIYRTINLPLQALDLLHPRHRDRFTVTVSGRTRVAGRNAAQIDFAEHTRPSLITDGFGGDRLVQGSAWVEPETGAVLRTEIRMEGNPGGMLKDALVRVDYRVDQRLQILLPSEMEERYGLDVEVLHGRARYRNYRRFETGARLVTP